MEKKIIRNYILFVLKYENEKLRQRDRNEKICSIRKTRIHNRDISYDIEIMNLLNQMMKINIG